MNPLENERIKTLQKELKQERIKVFLDFIEGKTPDDIREFIKSDNGIDLAQEVVKMDHCIHMQNFTMFARILQSERKWKRLGLLSDIPIINEVT